MVFDYYRAKKLFTLLLNFKPILSSLVLCSAFILSKDSRARQTALGSNIDLQFSSCLTLSKSLKFSAAQFPKCTKQDKNTQSAELLCV